MSDESNDARPHKKSFFVRGLVTLLPTVLTIVIIVTVLQFVDTYLTSPINRAIYTLLDGNALGWQGLSLMSIDPYDREFLNENALPTDLRDQIAQYGGTKALEFQAKLMDYRSEHETFLRDFKVLAIDGGKLREATRERVPPIFGVLISFSIVLTLGYLASGFLGRRVISSFDRTLNSIPIIKSVYPYTKQVVDFFLSDNQLEFDTVVAAPYPSEGLWSLGFVTGSGLASLNGELGGSFVSVFIPTSPMPMTGFTVFIRADRLHPLDISVDEALKVTVSAGVIIPAGESAGELTAALGRAGHA